MCRCDYGSDIRRRNAAVGQKRKDIEEGEDGADRQWSQYIKIGEIRQAGEETGTEIHILFHRRRHGAQPRTGG